jgi:pilus assembly protein CpaB
MNGTRILLLSLLMALIATVAFSFYANPSQPVAGESAETVEVLVAKIDIPKDTTITADMVLKKSLPNTFLPSGFETDSQKVVGMIAQERIFANEPFVTNRLVDAKSQDAAMVYKIPKGKRAISIAYNEVMGVSGFVRPGDFVDVVTVMTFKRGDEEVDLARILLQNMLVLATGTKKAEGSESNSVEQSSITTITLAVTPQEAETLTFSEEKGRVRLVLRGVKDEGQVNTPGVTKDSMYNKMTK